MVLGVVSCRLGVLVSVSALASLLYRRGGGPGARSSSSSVPAIIHSPYPTWKQVLAAVGTGSGSAFSVSGGLSALVTWRAYGVCWVLTEWVSQRPSAPS